MESCQFSSLHLKHCRKCRGREGDRRGRYSAQKNPLNLCYTDNHLCPAPQCTAGRAACSMHCDEEWWRVPPRDCLHIRGGGKVSKSNKCLAPAHCTQDTNHPRQAKPLNVKMDKEMSILDGTKQAKSQNLQIFLFQSPKHNTSISQHHSHTSRIFASQFWWGLKLQSKGGHAELRSKKVSLKCSITSTIMTFKCVIDSKNAIRASMIVWLTASMSGGATKADLKWRWEEWQGGGKFRGRGQAEDSITITSMSKQMVIGGHWRFKLCRRGRKKKCSDAETQTTAQTLIWNTHISAHTQTHQPEQLYPQRVGGEINASRRRD